MREKLGVMVEGVDISEFREKLKKNRGVCICSIDYDNPDMRCLCKEFRDSPIGTTCHCQIFQKISVD